jgi:imidazole glycerol phosphate synthase glutamine amidotransferase subunit
LGIVAGEVRRLRAAKVPHMGWNTLDVTNGSTILGAVAPDDMVYFVHSYYVDPDPAVVVATTTYEQPFCSAIEQDNIVGVQFHPEKSAEVGRRVLERFFGGLSR